MLRRPGPAGHDRIHGLREPLRERSSAAAAATASTGVMTSSRPGSRRPPTISRVAREFIAAYPQRGLLIVISDFLDDGGCEKPLQYLADFGHELMLIQLWADEDREPPWAGELELSDAETGSGLKLDFDEGARERYTTAFDEYCAVLQNAGAAQRRAVRRAPDVATDRRRRSSDRSDPGAGDRVTS